jgi:uncharacterized protein (DUF1501 family)
MVTRRDVLRSLPLISLAGTVPGFLARSARAVAPAKDGRVLVVIQLDGGNDGINTVVPYKDEGYARARKALRLRDDQLLGIAEGVGLHPAMREAAKLLESGRLAIVPGVGYPNPNRSHFESMAIWHTARPNPHERDGRGWLGCGLDHAAPTASPAALFVGKGAVPVALRSRTGTAAALARIEDFTLDPSAPPRQAVAAVARRDDLGDFVMRSNLDAYATSDRLAALGRDETRSRFPSTALGGRLKLIARLMRGEVSARIFYTKQTGYDTHAAQSGTHFSLLAELSGALRAFLDDLAAAGLAERVLILGFSEFGRRVAENDSAGTDHGTSGPVFLAGPRVRAGLAGPLPRLLDLEDGDLKMTVDFRRVYATLLEAWLGLPSREALGGTFEPLPLLLG